jgi:hypothetical protein
MSTIENTKKTLRFILEKFETGELDNDSLVQIIELCGFYLNLETIPNYAKRNKLSYNGVKKHRIIKKIFDVKFVIDNH